MYGVTDEGSLFKILRVCHSAIHWRSSFILFVVNTLLNFQGLSYSAEKKMAFTITVLTAEHTLSVHFYDRFVSLSLLIRITNRANKRAAIEL